MASIKDAVEESILDLNSVAKYFVTGGAIYWSMYLYFKSPQFLTLGFWSMTILTFFLLLGFLIKCTYNVRNGKDNVLPSWNYFHLLWAGIKGTIALGPAIAINSWLCALTLKFLLPFLANFSISGKGPETVIIGICVAIFSSIVMTSFVLYAKSFKIADAYNFNAISKFSIDILIKVLFFIPQLVFVNALIVGSVTYLFWVFLGIPNNFCTYFWCMSLVWNLAVIGNYMAQVDYETIETSGKEGGIY